KPELVALAETHGLKKTGKKAMAATIVAPMSAMLGLDAASMAASFGFRPRAIVGNHNLKA
ncbi:MAG: hypothetical protein ACO2ZD_12605, partial [Pseudomonadales bacterium]